MLFFALGFGPALFSSILVLGEPWELLAAPILLSALTWELFAGLLALPSLVGLIVVVQRIRHGREWRWSSYALGVCCLTLALVGAPAGYFFLKHLPAAFDAREWREEATTHAGVRVRRIDDLLEMGLVGSPVADLDELLGPDDSARGTGFGSGYFATWDRVWFLGPERSWMSIDSEWLVLRTDAGGRVVEARVVHD